MKRLIAFVSVLFALLMVAAIPVGASRAYQTYTYAIDGTPLYSPDAYTAVKNIDSAAMGLTTTLNNASDVVVDANENVYIVDTARTTACGLRLTRAETPRACRTVLPNPAECA